MKRLAFCFDGTWNRIDSVYPTNVARVAQLVRFEDGGTAQVVHYDEGVGTAKRERLRGGVFGHGLFANVARAYRFLVLNYEPGDQLFVFGFSRGAFTARSFVGLIRNVGIMSRRSLPHVGKALQLYSDRDPDAQPGSEMMRQFRYEHCPNLGVPGDREWRRLRYPDDRRRITDIEIAYLGVWDTVGALGIPAQLRLSFLSNRRYRFHDAQLSAVVRAARHAVAADERRRTFAPSLWDNLAALNGASPEPPYIEQVFPGAHGSVGGGGPVRGLSDAALEWVMDGARKQGLAFDTDSGSSIYGVRPDHRASLFNIVGKARETVGDRIMGFGLQDRDFASLDVGAIHDSLIRRFAEPASALPERRKYRPASLRQMWNAIAARGDRQHALPETKGAGGAKSPPDAIELYVVERGDTLTAIAAAKMGHADQANLLFEHNRMLGRLHDPDKLYIGQELEIPIYRTTAGEKVPPA